MARNLANDEDATLALIAASCEPAVEVRWTQRTVLPGEARAANLVADLAQQILDLDERVKELDAEITEVLTGDETAEIIQSIPGIGSAADRGVHRPDR
jgi:transposase